jgi:hypothetical protein
MVLCIKDYVLVCGSELNALFVNDTLLQMLYESVLVGLLLVHFQNIVACDFQFLYVVEFCQHKQNALSHFFVIGKVPSDVLCQLVQTLVPFPDVLFAYDNDHPQFLHLLNCFVSVQCVHNVDFARSALLNTCSVDQAKLLRKCVLFWGLQFGWFSGAGC